MKQGKRMKTRRKSPVNLTTTDQHFCSIDLRLKILGRLPFFSDLSQMELESINQRFNSFGYHASEYIYFAGDVAERLFVVAEGKIKIFQQSDNGRNVLLDILSEGDFFGNLTVLGASGYPDTTQALTSACVLTIHSEGFGQILDEYPRLAIKTIQVMEKRLIAANNQVFTISSLTVEKRIANTLLELGRKLGVNKENSLLIDAPISREDLAEMTAATPETVSRVMKQFQNNGLINSGRLWVSIRNLEELRKFTEID
jgi:CRP-like cAMP-binding protein